LTYVSIVVLTREYRSSNDKRAEGADGRERRQAGKHGENVSRPTAAGERHPGPELSERRDGTLVDQRQWLRHFVESPLAKATKSVRTSWGCR
jgi:hypothetical protein